MTIVSEELAPEMWEALQAVERWAHGEGIELSPSLRKRITAVREKVTAAESEAV